MSTEYNYELIRQLDTDGVGIEYRRYVRELLACIEGEGCVTLEAAEERLTEEDFLETMHFEEGPFATLLGMLRNFKRMNRPAYDKALEKTLLLIRRTMEEQK